MEEFTAVYECDSGMDAQSRGLGTNGDVVNRAKRLIFDGEIRLCQRADQHLEWRNVGAQIANMKLMRLGHK